MDESKSMSISKKGAIGGYQCLGQVVCIRMPSNLVESSVSFEFNMEINVSPLLGQATNP